LISQERKKINLEKEKKMLVRFCFLFFVIFFSCDNNKIFDQYQNINTYWDKERSVDFSFDLEDKSYNTFINLRVDNNYVYNNIFLIVSISDSLKTFSIDTLEFSMANKNGKLLGKKLLNTYNSKLWHKEDLKLKKGSYTVSIKHAMRKINQINGIDKLEGIVNVGYRIEKK